MTRLDHTDMALRMTTSRCKGPPVRPMTQRSVPGRTAGPAKGASRCGPGRTTGLARGAARCIPGRTSGPARGAACCVPGRTCGPARDTARCAPGLLSGQGSSTLRPWPHRRSDHRSGQGRSVLRPWRKITMRTHVQRYDYAFWILHCFLQEKTANHNVGLFFL